MGTTLVALFARAATRQPQPCLGVMAYTCIPITQLGTQPCRPPEIRYYLSRLAFSFQALEREDSH